jgi:ketosteroid isomerase-like protein
VTANSGILASVSRENIELVRRVNEAHERGDFAAVFAAYDQEIEWHVARVASAVVGFDPLYVGHDGVRSFWRQWFSAWQTTSFEFEELIDAGDQVVVVMSQRMRGRTSGIELEWNSYAQVWTVREGKLTRAEFFPTRAEALEALGLED